MEEKAKSCLEECHERSRWGLGTATGFWAVDVIWQNHEIAGEKIFK